jgi:hypothetical protein
MDQEPAMERPELPELDAIMRAVDELRVQEQRLAQAKAAVAAAVDGLVDVVDPAVRLDAAVYAYWHAPETNAMQLAKLTVGKASSALMLKQADAVSIGVDCGRCGEDLAIVSRTMMHKVLTASAGRILCEACREAVQREWQEERARRDREEGDRRRVLARLPYAEYLATPEWQAERASVMRVALHVHGRLSCEVCPEREGLWFVHRELDLIDRVERVSLLCGTCAGALEGVGKLARPRTPANRAHRNLLDPVERAFRVERGWDEPR